MHYFEEDGIEGTLYAEDGTEYKPASKATSKVAANLTPKELLSRRSSKHRYSIYFLYLHKK